MTPFDILDELAREGARYPDPPKRAPRLRTVERQARTDKILALRKRNVSQAAIAERLGLSQQRVSEIIRKARSNTRLGTAFGLGGAGHGERVLHGERN